MNQVISNSTSTHKLSPELIRDIDVRLNILSTVLPEEDQCSEIDEMILRWHQVHSRIVIYAEQKEYVKSNQWLENDKNLRNHLRKIDDALIAIRFTAELSLDKSIKLQIMNDLARIIEIHLLKIEIMQLKHLEVDLKISRMSDIMTLDMKYHSDMTALGKELRQKKLSKKFDINSYPTIKKVFKQHERRPVRLKKHVERSRKVSDVTMIVNAGYSLLTSIQNILPSLANALRGLGSMLAAIPLVAAFAAAAPILLGAAKSWINNQAPVRKGISTGLALIVIGGIVASGLAPAAALGIICAMTGIGVISGMVLPRIMIGRKINTKKKELALIEKRENKLRYTLDQHAQKLNLEVYEQNAIMKKLEEYIIKHADIYIAPQEIQAARNAIVNGTIKSVSENILITKAIYDNVNDAEDRTMKHQLIVIAEERTKALTAEMQMLNKVKNRMTATVVAGTVGFIGAVLICIPIPPVMILGAALIAASSIAGPIIKYNLIGRAINAISSLVQKKSKEEKSVLSEDEQLIHSKPFKRRYSMEKIVDRPAKEIIDEKAANKIEARRLKEEMMKTQRKTASNQNFSASMNNDQENEVKSKSSYANIFKREK